MPTTPTIILYSGYSDLYNSYSSSFPTNISISFISYPKLCNVFNVLSPKYLCLLYEGIAILIYIIKIF